MQSLKYLISVLQVWRFDFVKFRNWAILSFHQCLSSVDPDQIPPLCLILVCTVYLCYIKRTLGLYGLVKDCIL